MLLGFPSSFSTLGGFLIQSIQSFQFIGRDGFHSHNFLYPRTILPETDCWSLSDLVPATETPCVWTSLPGEEKQQVLSGIIVTHHRYPRPGFFIWNFNSWFTNHINGPLHPSATSHKAQSKHLILSVNPRYHWAGVSSLKPMAESWQNVLDSAEFNWQSSYRKLRPQETTVHFFTVATDSTSWPRGKPTEYI